VLAVSEICTWGVAPCPPALWHAWCNLTAYIARLMLCNHIILYILVYFVCISDLYCVIFNAISLVIVIYRINAYLNLELKFYVY
jgi:hypothetical protein